MMHSTCTETTSKSSSDEWDYPTTTGPENIHAQRIENGTNYLTSPATDRVDYSTTTEDYAHAGGEKALGTTSTTDDSFEATTTEIEHHACPKDFEQLTLDWCFHMQYNEEWRPNFQKTQDYCSQKGAILPAITSVEVTTALMLERTTKMGISPFEAFFIGLGCETRKRHWMWIDGPPYDPSDAFFSRSSTNPEHCHPRDQPFIFDQFGTWSHHDVYSLNPRLIVCAVRPSGYSPPNPVTAPCTEMWTQLPGGYCYRLQANLGTSLNAYDAEQECKLLGGHLPAIRSAVQSDVILTYLIGKGHQLSNFWIGLTCTRSGEAYAPQDYALEPESGGKRAWVDGTPFSLDYTNFLDPADATDTCSISFVEPFLYSGNTNGKWVKERFNVSLDVLMCTRPDPEPIMSTSTSTTTTKTTKTIPSTRKTTTETTEDTTIFPTDATTENVAMHTGSSTAFTSGPDNTPSTDATIITTIITTRVEPTTTSLDKKKALTELEIILIISLATIIITVVIVVLLYFLCKRIRKERVQEMVNKMQKRFSRSNTNAITRTDEWEIRRQFVSIDYSRQLGRGAFGRVYLGRVYSGNIPDMAIKTLLQLNALKKDDDFVAVKTLHETADSEAALELKEEINIMKKIGFHERLVNLLGCVTESEPFLLIVEYCSNGDLLGFMRERRMFMLKLKDTVGDSIAGRHSIITSRQQLMFGIQIAYGMEYLGQRGFVHRDLAARNILVDKNESCKIGDFGLCRQIGKESEQYISRGGRLPWKWMAPEALERYYFSVESDVWAFGVLLFEIITLGGNPYADWPAVELIPRLKSGERLPKPDGCSDGFYKIMMACWQGVPLSRMSFENIRRQLGHELEESSNDDYYLKLNAGAKYYQETLEPERNLRFNSF